MDRGPATRIIVIMERHRTREAALAAAQDSLGDARKLLRTRTTTEMRNAEVCCRCAAGQPCTQTVMEYSDDDRVIVHDPAD